MNRAFLVNEIVSKQSYLCVGLDTDETKLPQHLRGKKDAVLQFNKAIIDATKDHCVSYKINTAFYEAMGARGWEIMEETFAYIPTTHFTIADAKRGDIGNTSHQYARAFFEHMKMDHCAWPDQQQRQRRFSAIGFGAQAGWTGIGAQYCKWRTK
jgi:orotidine-5'-phosphate decarboxylase